MNNLLANVAVFKQKAYNFHWNVRGSNFVIMHKLTEDLYLGLVEFFDQIAEKISMQGKVPHSTFQSYISNAEIKEVEPRAFTQQEVVEMVVADFNTMQKHVYNVKTSTVIQPLLDEIYLFIDKQRWLFNSSK